jgi:pantothenate kinase
MTANSTTRTLKNSAASILIVIVSSLFLSFFRQGAGVVQAASFFFPLIESSSSIATTTFVVTTRRNHRRHLYEDDSFSVNGGGPFQRHWWQQQHPKGNQKKKTLALCSSIMNMDETYDTLACDAIEKLHLLRSQQQQQNTDIHNNVGSRCRRRLWIGLAGGPGSGKSTVAAAVVDRINNNKKHVNDDAVRAMVLPMDGFHYTQAYLKEHDMDMKRRGAPWTFDAKNMYEKLKNAVTVNNNNNNDQVETDEETSFWFPSYNRDISDPVENAICIDSSHDIIIVEGLYMLLGALVDQAQDVSSPLLQTIQKFPDNWRSTSSSLEQQNDNTDYSTAYWSMLQAEIAKWKPITDLFDETWYVQAPGGLPEQEQRLIQRSLQTWTDAKTKLWSGVSDNSHVTSMTADQAATLRVQYNDAPNGQLVECCRPYADRIFETR